MKINIFFRGTESKLKGIQNIDDYTMMCNGNDKSDRSESGTD
jgi:hypothetical protein